MYEIVNVPGTVLDTPKLDALQQFLEGRTKSVEPSNELQGMACSDDPSVFDLVIRIGTQDDNAPGWYFVPLKIELPSGELTQTSDWSAAAIRWEIALVSSEQVDVQVWRSLPRSMTESLRVISSPSLGSWLAIPIFEGQIVADSLLRWGVPPAMVQQDWRVQLRKIQRGDRDADSAPRQLSPILTWMDHDGVLASLSDLVWMLRKVTSHIEFSQQLRTWIESRTIPYKLVTWPRPIPIPRTDNTDHNAILEHPSLSIGLPPLGLPPRRGPKRPRKSFHGKGLAILSIGLIGMLIATVAIWFAPTTKRPVSRDSQSAALSLKSSVASTDEPSLSEPGPTLADDDPMPLVTSDLGLTIEPFAIDIPELHVEGLPIATDPKLSSSSSIHSSKGLNAKSIVERSLDVTSRAMVADAANDESSDDEEPDTSNTKDERDDGHIDQAIVVGRATQSTLLKMRRRVDARRASLQATLSSKGDAIIIPDEPVTLQGSGVLRWQVSVEKIDPILVVELYSKPGMRWRVVTQVGVQLEPNGVTMPLSPGDATLVGRRLMEYQKWLLQSVATLRIARNNARGKQVGDMLAQIRALESEQKETERAIRQWEQIARLSFKFFDQHTLNVTATP